MFPTFPIFSSFLCAKEGVPWLRIGQSLSLLLYACQCFFLFPSVLHALQPLQPPQEPPQPVQPRCFPAFRSEPVCKSGTDRAPSDHQNQNHCICHRAFLHTFGKRPDIRNVQPPPFSILYPVLSLPPVQTVWSKPSDPCRDRV